MDGWIGMSHENLSFFNLILKTVTFPLLNCMYKTKIYYTCVNLLVQL